MNIACGTSEGQTYGSSINRATFNLNKSIKFWFFSIAGSLLLGSLYTSCGDESSTCSQFK